MRDKWTMFMTNRPDCFAELSKTCDQAHDHLPWGVYLEMMTKDLSAIRTFLFIDNEAARAALIAMYSPITLHAQMLKDLNSIVMSRSLYMWTARVPSAANPADGPSRNMVSENMKQRGTELKIHWSLKETYKG